MALVRRDLRVALRRSGDTLQPLGFFVVVTTLFPLALQPEVSLLRDIAPAALWVGALLASLLALDLLFREDAQDGTLEQLALCGLPLTGLVMAKTAVHWMLTGLPLVLVAPLAAWRSACRPRALPAILVALLLGSVTLSLIGAVGAGSDDGHEAQRFAAGAAGAAAGRAGADLRRARDGVGDPWQRWPRRCICWRPWPC